MSAALIDLVSKGAQDVFITGEPQVSFFRQNYKRHTNFSMKPERMDYIGSFGASNEITVPIRSKGDLLSYIWIEDTLISNVATNTDGLFSADASNPTTFQLWIGGQKVSELDSLFIQGAYNPLLRDNSAKASCTVTTNVAKENHGQNHFMIPFFFGEDWTKALPLVALQYHEVELRIKCRDGYTPQGTPKIYGNYIYVDTDERKYFTETEHEILFTQTQYQPATSTDTEMDLSYFNHPVKSIHLISGAAAGQKWYDEYTFGTSSLYINGTALFENSSNVYHHNIVPQMHCTDLPDDVLDDLPTYSWPFCLSMSKAQPSGTLNFSRIDNAKLLVNNVSGGNNLHRVYAVNFNILRIKNGMAGVAFGN
jgi:hypothetical protein|uniref:Major capsid protein N-terminal domain-containing protein n=1 Tax=viral metagenome TaxID=1070528 RepID=A0A6C0JF67_9ZZZZ|tara:strand:+ start:595 stop:1692 length:1098 start_codon:yes stop_codon:yes gene_type:complete